MTGMRFLGTQEQMESVTMHWHKSQSVETSRKAECVGGSSWQVRWWREHLEVHFWPVFLWDVEIKVVIWERGWERC